MIRSLSVPLIVLSVPSIGAFVVSPSAPVVAPRTTASASSSSLAALSTSGLWNNGNSYGKGPFRFYENFESWIAPFPEEDRAAYPEIFTVPQGVYEVSLRRPLGIVFGERDGDDDDDDDAPRGVEVLETVEGGNAASTGGLVRPGDVLLCVTAVKVSGAKWERRLLPATRFDFDTTVNAIGSNDPKWGCEDVVLMLYRPDEADPDEVREFLEFFEPPSDSMWRR